jgi:hypothetical protein
MFCRVTRVMPQGCPAVVLPSKSRLLHFGKPPKEYRIQMKICCTSRERSLSKQISTLYFAYARLPNAKNIEGGTQQRPGLIS